MKNLFYLALFSIVIIACEQNKPEPNPTPENTNILDSICVNCFAFDSEGTVWIGTLSQGLVKHNSTETKVFNASNSSINNAPIWDIEIDNDDNVWLGTDGLVKFDGANFTSYTTVNSNIPEDVVWSLAVDSKNNIWAASNRFREGGLVKFDGNDFEVFLPDNSALPRNEVTCIAIDHEDNVWLSVTHKVNDTFLVRISDDQWTIYDRDDFGQELCWISKIEFNNQNQVCGTIRNGYCGGSDKRPRIFEFDGNSVEFTTMEEGTYTEEFSTIMVDKDDNYWCTFGSGYAYYDGMQWHKTKSDVIENDGGNSYKNAYFAIEQAPDGNIWLGTDIGIEVLEINE